MKHLFILLAFVAVTVAVQAQTGPGIIFRYDQAGYRIVREFNNWASLAKPGKDSTGQQADTVIGYFQNEEKTPLDRNVFVRAYPNPVRDVLFVENLSWQDGGSATLKIYDISGKLIMEKTTTQPKETIQMGALPPGNYHVKYYTNYTYLISWQIAKI